MSREFARVQIAAALCVLLSACGSGGPAKAGHYDSTAKPGRYDDDFAIVSDTPAGAFETSLAVFDDGFVSAWYDTRDDHAEIYIRRLDPQGRPTAAAHRITQTDGEAYEVDIQPYRGNIVAAWYDKSIDGRLTPWLGAWTRDGVRLWWTQLAAQGRNTIVRVDGDTLFAAWLQDDDGEHSSVWGGWWQGDGTAMGTPRRLADASRTTWNLNGAIDASDAGAHHAVVAFDAALRTKSSELFVVDTGDAGDEVTRVTPDDGFASKYPDIAFSGDRVAITWFDEKDGNQEIYLATGTREMLHATERLRRVRVTTTPGHSIGAYLAWNGDRIGVSWCDDSDGGQHEVFFQSFLASGQPAADAMRLTHTRAASMIPAIKPWKSGFALAWTEYDPPTGDGHTGGRSQVALRTIDAPVLARR